MEDVKKYSRRWRGRDIAKLADNLGHSNLYHSNLYQFNKNGHRQ